MPHNFSSPGSIAVLHKIANLVTHPMSYEEIGKRTGLANVTVGVYVKQLCGIGALRVHNAVGRAESGRQVALYVQGDLSGMPPLPKVMPPAERRRTLVRRALPEKPGPIRFKTEVIVRRDPFTAAFFGSPR